jgi:2-phospho-L-lactate guanylyltransferase
LRGSVHGAPHERLALALALDTVRAVLACPMVAEVLVVTDDPEAATRLGDLGAWVVPDQPAAGLNPAMSYGAELAGRAHVGGGAQVGGAAAGSGTCRPQRWVAALAADLPALRPSELAGALRDLLDGAEGRGFVPDAAGTGTTLLAAPPGVALDPRFGPDSAAKHAASGARRLAGDWASLRRDVDTIHDLTEAERLGLGPHTAAVWRELVKNNPVTLPPQGGGPPRWCGSGRAPARGG